MLVLLVIYNHSPGYADDGVQPHVTAMVHADEKMVGWLTGERSQTVWLQRYLYKPHTHWYDIIVSLLYFSHFIATPSVAAVWYVRHRPSRRHFVTLWFTPSALGVMNLLRLPCGTTAVGGGARLPAAKYSTAPPRGWCSVGTVHEDNLLNAAKLDGANIICSHALLA